MYKELRNKFEKIIKNHGLESINVNVTSKVLTKKEALGNPEHNDYPLLKGRENLMESEFCGSKGAAYSDMCGDFRGTLSNVMDMSLENNYQRAVFISTINAVLKHLKLISLTEHCKDNGPVDCAGNLKEYFEHNYPGSKILLIGYQPRFAEIITNFFDSNIIDLDIKNVGKEINGIKISSEDSTENLIAQSDVLFTTSSTFVNGTASKFILPDKETIFYGVSGAGPTYLLGLKRYCHQ